MRTPENLLHDRIDANGHDWDAFKNQCRDYLPVIYSAMAHHSVEYMQGLRQALRDVRKHRNDLLARRDFLEEWLTEYRDQLKTENVFHKNQGIINAINELLACEHCNGSGYDPYPNHDTTMRPCPKCSGV